jgi:beta-glucanase (GH16 family)
MKYLPIVLITLIICPVSFLTVGFSLASDNNWGKHHNRDGCNCDCSKCPGAVAPAPVTPAPKPVVTPPAPTPVTTPTPVVASGSVKVPAQYANKNPSMVIDFKSGLPKGWLPAIADGYGVWRKTVPAPYSAGDSGKFNAEYYDPANLITGPDGLKIKTERSNKFSGYTWASGALTSHGAYYFKSGYINFKAKVPDSKNGMWGGFWFLEGGGEIDLIEIGFTKGNIDPNRIMAFNLHTSGNSQQLIDTGIDLTKDFHDYGLEYSPGKFVKAYLDGKLVGTYTNNVPTGGYEVIINGQVAQNSQGWHTIAGPNTESPNYFHVKEVRIYPLQ